MRRLIFMVALLFVAIACKDNNVDKPVEQPTFEVTTDALELDYREQRVEIEVMTVLEDVDISEQVLWITVNGFEDGKVKLTIKANDTESAREADVVITAGDKSHTVHITQLQKPDMLTLELGHTSLLLDSPEWGGEGVSGAIDWGDGTEEQYEAGASHEYADSQKRTATFEMEGATSFKIERLGEIESVEITL